MTLYNKKKDKLMANITDKEYRESFVASHISNGIALQIRTMRGKLTQGEFGILTDMKQEQISRLENPDNEMFTVKTLLRLAAARDVALMVRFVPFGDLIKWDLNLSTKSLEVPSFKHDPYFKEISGDTATIADNDKYSGLSLQAASNDNDVFNLMKDLRDNLSRQQITDLPMASCG